VELGPIFPQTLAAVAAAPAAMDSTTVPVQMLEKVALEKLVTSKVPKSFTLAVAVQLDLLQVPVMVQQMLAAAELVALGKTVL
jgi:hypothetical protein